MERKKKKTIGVQKRIFHSQLILVISLTVIMALAGVLFIIMVDTEQQDRNLKNVAEAITSLETGESLMGTEDLTLILDTLKESISDVDVISVVGTDLIRVYHSNHALIGTTYDGTLPDFEQQGEAGSRAYYDYGPSGSQRRVYAAIYDSDGNYMGFVLIAMLTANLRSEILRVIGLFAVIVLAAVLVEFLISYWLSRRIKRDLMGYEPGVFSAMYRIRDNILESLGEGVIAVDRDAKVQFHNASASEMLGIGEKVPEELGARLLGETILSGEPQFSVRVHDFPTEHILMDRFPIREDGNIIGALGILHDRTTYTKLQEDLTGARYLVDSMRANNHDFTNKLHVILGLIQMEKYDEAMSYIENITIVQREMISKVMNAVDEPSVAALLIGKISRACELNIKFVLQEGSCLRRTDSEIPEQAIVTIIGNLTDNAMESINASDSLERRELTLGIFSKPGALLLTVDDTGGGIAKENLGRIFENGFSTKGEGRGTGLYRVRELVEDLGGHIAVDSQIGVGTSFTVSFQADEPKGEQSYVPGSDS